MSHSLNKTQGIESALDLQASMWANKIMTKKSNNHQVKFEIAQAFGFDKIEEMQDRVRKYLKAGLVTEKTYATNIDSRLESLKQHSKAPVKLSESTHQSKDGLWSTKIGARS